MSQKKWKTAGYISLSRNKSVVVIKIGNPETGGDYYIGLVDEVLDAITGRTAYAKIYQKKSES